MPDESSKSKIRFQAKSECHPVLDIVLLTICFIIFFRDAISYNNIFFYIDHGFQNIPFRWFAFQSLKEGIVPLWCPYSAGGFPFFAEGQSGFSYVVNWLFYCLLPFSIAYNWSLLIHLLFWGYGHYFLFRLFNYKSTSAMFGAIALTFCGYMTRKLLFVNYIQCISYLPWILLIASSNKINQKYKMILITVIFALQWFSGHPQAMIISLTCFWLFIVFAPFVSNRIKLIKLGAVTTICGTALAAWQLLPTTELLNHTQRLGQNSDAITGQMALPPSYLPMIFLNHIFGSAHVGSFDTSLWPAYEWELSIFLGLSVFTFALMTGFSKSKHRFYWSCVIFGFCLAIGPFTPIYTWIAKLPVFNGFRAPARWSIIGIWGLTALAVDFFESLQVKPSNIRKIRFLGAFSITGILLAAAYAVRSSAVIFNSDSTRLIIGSVIVFFLSALLVVLMKISRQRRLFPYLIILLVFGELYWGGYNYCALADKSIILNKPQILDSLESDTQILSLIHEGSPNINVNWHENWSLNEHGDYEQLKNSLPMYSGMIHRIKIMTFNEWSPLHFQAYKSWGQRLAFLKFRTISNFNVTHVLSSEKNKSFPGIFCQSFNGWVFCKIDLKQFDQDIREPINASDLSMSEVFTKLSKLSKEKSLTSMDRPVLLEKLQDFSGVTKKIKSKMTGINEMSVSNSNETNGLYVIPSVYDQNWKMNTNGQAQNLELVRTDGLFLGLLFSGKFDVQLIYLPVSYRLGLFVSLVMVCGLVWFTLGYKDRKIDSEDSQNIKRSIGFTSWLFIHIILLMICIGGVMLNLEMWQTTFYNWLI